MEQEEEKFEIESGIAIPNRRGSIASSRFLSVARDMVVGDSVGLKTPKEAYQLISQLKKLGRGGIQRKMNDKFRVWRTK